jgi:hypothetical protein
MVSCQFDLSLTDLLPENGLLPISREFDASLTDLLLQKFLLPI